MKTIALFFLVFFEATLILAQSSTKGSYHHSALFNQEVLYLSDGLALVRTVGFYSSDTPEIIYAIHKATWLGEPELADISGDRLDKSVIANIKSMRWITDSNVIVGIGSDPNGVENVFFMLDATKQKVVFFGNVNDLKNALGPKEGVDLMLTRSEYYFRMIVENRKKLF